MIQLEGKDVLVIGGGNEGTQKVRVLAMFCCRITLIAPKAELSATEIADVYIAREFEDTDITEEYTLIVAATDDDEVNRRISRLAGELKIPVNVVDNADLCTFIFPAIVKDKDVVIAVSSGGKSPHVTQYIKNLIIKKMPDNIGDINERMGKIRTFAKMEIHDSAERREYLKKKLSELVE